MEPMLDLETDPDDAPPEGEGEIGNLSDESAAFDKIHFQLQSFYSDLLAAHPEHGRLDTGAALDHLVAHETEIYAFLRRAGLTDLLDRIGADPGSEDEQRLLRRLSTRYFPLRKVNF
jgi:hypothetical protein